MLGWNVTTEVYFFFGMTALIGGLAGLAIHLTIEDQLHKVGKILEKCGLVDIEQDFS